nr:uncharacterized protein LOC125633693 [Caretta caretta]
MEQPNFTLDRVAETELEKMRLDMELTMLKCQYEEKEKQRQHKEKMEQMRLQAPSGHVSSGESVNRGRHDPDVCSPRGPSLKYFQISTKIHFFEKTSIQKNGASVAITALMDNHSVGKLLLFLSVAHIEQVLVNGKNMALQYHTFLPLCPQPAEGCLDLLMPQNQFALFLYCFIFIHVIYTARDLLLFFVKKHHLFIIVVTLLYLIKKLWDYLCCSQFFL